jgi:hypothetical protein
MAPPVITLHHLLATLLAFSECAEHGAECKISIAWCGRLFQPAILLCRLGVFHYGIIAATKN